ncbi:hypothetical protein FMEXI_5082 [Fusarium mexicanum]|uniref:Uncharacterized protein n=1 Tax=Fusarium mexicanum TaxID=751941 RepID=A0A8H5J786_9HYPO|nr:hypothetical protein FMEXI_5082 [Fusarium mexicanum]
MSKQTTIGGQPGGSPVFGPALKNQVDKVKEIRGKVSESLDRVRRRPVSRATEAGFTPENVDKAKGWRTDVDALDAQLQAQVREHVRVDETLRDLRDQLRQYDSILAEVRELGGGNDEPSQQLAAEFLGWLMQENPRVRLFVEAMGDEITPALEQAISGLNVGDQNDPSTVRIGQVATLGLRREKLIEQIDRESENDQGTQNELRAVNDEQMEGSEAQLRQHETTFEEWQTSREALQSELDTLRKELDAKDSNIRDLTAQVASDREKLGEHEELVNSQQLLIKERDEARTEVEYYRRLADSIKISSDKWMNLCSKRDRNILRFESQVADLMQQLKATRTQETTQERAGGNFSEELRDVQQTIQEHGRSIDSAQHSVNAYGNEARGYAELTDLNERLKGQVKSLSNQATHYKRRGDKYNSALDKAKQAAGAMTKLLMAQSPSGVEWPGIIERIDWNTELVVALPTQNTWKVQETWSKDPMLAVGKRTESLTALLLQIVASVESRSFVDVVSFLAAVQTRLDDDSKCIFQVVKLFLDAVSVCIELEGVHAFQIFLLLQVAERIGRAWPMVQDTVNELANRGGSHERISSVSRSVTLWGQGQRLSCETSLECQDWTLVGFFRKPNGILLRGGSELRWADHDFVEIDHDGITATITIGEEEDKIEFGVEGQEWIWWVEHIL